MTRSYTILTDVTRTGQREQAFWIRRHASEGAVTKHSCRLALCANPLSRTLWERKEKTVWLARRTHRLFVVDRALLLTCHLRKSQPPQRPAGKRETNIERVSRELSAT